MQKSFIRSLTISIAASSLALISVTEVFSQTTKPANAFPDSWYILPEDTGGHITASEDRHQFSSHDLDATAAKDSIDRTMEANMRILNEVVSDQKFIATEQNASTPWRLAFFGLDFGLSASGVAGILFTKGEATINLYWKRLIGQSSNMDSTSNNADQAADFTVRGAMTKDEVKAAIDPVIKSVLATGTVNNEPALRANLLAQAEQFAAMVSNISIEPNLRWAPVRMRFDLSVDGAGMVQPGLYVGGGIKIRFDWFPSAANFKQRNDLASTKDATLPNDPNLNRLLQQLAHELELVKIDSSQSPENLSLTMIDFSLALFANAKFGLAKGSINAMGMVYFRQNPSFDETKDIPNVDWTAESIPVIEGRPSDNHLEFARQLGVRVALTTDMKDQPTKLAMYSVPHEALEQGLKKTITMGGMLASRAAAHQSKDWSLDQLRAQFALSLGGSAGLVTVGATGAIQLVYQAPATLH